MENFQSSTLSPHSYLVTGGCGFIGTSLISHLLKRDPLVGIRVLDNLSVGTRDDLAEVSDIINRNIADLSEQIPSGKTELVIGDIRDFETCRKSCVGIDVVIHLAANTGVGPSVENPRADMESNVIGTFNMLEAARICGVKNFIFASSGAPIGEVKPPIHEEKAPRPVSPYGASKLAGEGYCSCYYRTFGVKTVSLRFGNIYGPRSKHKGSVVAKFIKNAFSGKTLEIYGDGSQTRDFIYIDDLIQAICLAINPKPESELNSPNSLLSPQPSVLSPVANPYGEVFQIATHKETTVNEIAEKIKAIFQRETGRSVSIIYGKCRIGDVKRNYSDISKARRILGFEPSFDLETGLLRTFKYFEAGTLRSLQ